MKKPLLLSVAFFLFYLVVSASPIDAVPLRVLIMKSEYIVQGRAVFFGKENPEKYEDRWKTDFVLIKVDEVLQGKLHTDTVKIYYYGAVVCPAPPQFVKGCEGIFFLNAEDETKQSFYVYGRNYGTKNFTEKEKLAVYKQRIVEMQAINRMQDKQQQQEAIIDWVVTCAVNPYTNSEGLYELVPERRYIARDPRVKLNWDKIELNYPRRQRIFNAVMARDTLHEVDMDLVDLAMGVDDQALLKKLKKDLNCVDTSFRSLLFIEIMMRRIVTLTGDNELQQLMTGFRDSFYSRQRRVRPNKELFLEFRRKMENVPVKKELTAGHDKTV